MSHWADRVSLVFFDNRKKELKSETTGSEEMRCWIGVNEGLIEGVSQHLSDSAFHSK